MLKKITFYLMMILTSFAILVLAAEAMLRIFAPQPQAIRWLQSSELYGSVNKKNFRQDYRYLDSGFVMRIRTNSLGLRDREYDLRNDDSKRVLLLGDSFVFGYGLNQDQLFDSKLEGLLNDSGRKYLVINTGVGGWGTMQETAYARRHFDLFKPDIIVITFCGNDPSDDTKYLVGMSDLERGLYYFPGKIFLREHSELYKFIVRKCYTIWWNRAMRARLGKEGDPGGEKKVDKQSAAVISEEEWSRTRACVREFYAEFRRFNPDGVLLIQATNPLDPDIRRHLASLSDGEALIYVDLYDRLINLTPEEMRLHPGSKDKHWNERVHGIVADKLFETVTSVEAGHNQKGEPASHGR